jgi:hypothetical protein
MYLITFLLNIHKQISELVYKIHCIVIVGGFLKVEYDRSLVHAVPTGGTIALYCSRDRPNLKLVLHPAVHVFARTCSPNLLVVAIPQRT